MPAPLFMSMREVSDLSGIPIETLRRWRKERRGDGPPAVLVGGSVRYKRAEFQSWYDSLTSETAGATGTDG